MIQTHDFLTDYSSDKVARILKIFSDATTSRDVTFLNEILHENYSVLICQSGSERYMTKSEYLQLMREEKVGGTARKFEILNLQTGSAVSFASVRHSTSNKFFDENFMLQKANDR